MDLRQLKIVAPSGHGRNVAVELDGESIVDGLEGITLRLSANDLTTAQLDLGYVASEFEGQAKVILREETAMLLKQLGWTPPDDA